MAPFLRRTRGWAAVRRSPLAPAVARPGPDIFDDLDERAADATADLLSPDAIDLSAPDYLRLDGRYARTLILTGYPPTVFLGWLEPLLSAPMTLDVSLHLVPQNARDAQRVLSQSMVKLHSQRLAGARSGLLEETETETAYAHCAGLRESLQRGEERVLTASVYLTVYATTLAELEARTTRVEELLGAALAGTRRATWGGLAGLRGALPLGDDALYSRRTARTLDTSTLATLFPFSGATLQMEGGVLLGTNVETHAHVVLDAFSRTLLNYNQVVVATSGAGKSYTVKYMVTRAAPREGQTLIIDPTGEYAPIARAVGGRVIRLCAGSPHRINPLDLPLVTAQDDRDGEDEGDAADGAESGWEDADDAEHDALKDRIAGVHGLFDLLLAGEGHRLTTHEKGALDGALRRCYAEKGITPDPATHRRPAPLFADLRDTLRAAGDTHGLAQRLDLYCGEGSLGGLFSGATTVRADGRVVVFDLHQLAEDLWPAAMYLTGQYIWGVAGSDPVGGRRLPRRVIVDEAQLLTAHASGGALLGDVARRGRKRFVGLTAISQDVRDFLHTKPGQALLTNSSVRFLLRQDESTLEALDESLRLTPQERTYLAQCPRGEALLVVQGTRLKVALEASPQEHLYCTTDPHDAAVVKPRRRPQAA